jgi:hypothetical protein
MILSGFAACEWLRVSVGLGNEAVDGGLEIDDGVKDAALQSTPAELCEKSLDGVEPGARGWCEMEDKSRMAIEPSANVRMFVGGIVVENDVDDLADRNLRLDGVQKSNEFLMTMALHVAADDRAVEDVKRSEQRRGTVPLVIVGHGSEPALLQRQARLGAIEGLNLALLVDRQDDGMGRRVDIEPDDVAQLGDEVRIVRELELSAPMGLEPVRLPDAADRAGTDAARPRHQVGRPVRRFGRRVGQRERYHTLGHLRAKPGDPRGPRLVSQEAVEAFFHEPLLLAPDASLGRAGLAHDLVGTDAVRTQKHDGRAPSVFLRGVTVLSDRLEPTAIWPCNLDGNPGAHAPDSHARPLKGIPKGLFC